MTMTILVIIKDVMIITRAEVEVVTTIINLLKGIGTEKTSDETTDAMIEEMTGSTTDKTTDEGIVVTTIIAAMTTTTSSSLVVHTSVHQEVVPRVDKIWTTTGFSTLRNNTAALTATGISSPPPFPSSRIDETMTTTWMKIK